LVLKVRVRWVAYAVDDVRDSVSDVEFGPKVPEKYADASPSSAAMR
jgi:hypothetical protein